MPVATFSPVPSRGGTIRYEYTKSLTSVAINAGGSGYAVSDVVVLAGGTAYTRAEITVTSVDGGGAITGLTISEQGLYSVPVTSFTQYSTTGSGTGATFDSGVQSNNYTYTVYNGATNGGTGRDPSPTGGQVFEEWRGFISFDTSSIPVGSTVISARLNMAFSTGSYPPFDPDDFVWLFWVGSFVAGPIDSGDWNAGSFTKYLDWPSAPTDGWQTLTNSLNQINISGYTDFRFQDISNYSAPTALWLAQPKVSSTTQLEVTYVLPPRVVSIT